LLNRRSSRPKRSFVREKSTATDGFADPRARSGHDGHLLHT
jgi:hypothetical protein